MTGPVHQRNMSHHPSAPGGCASSLSNTNYSKYVYVSNSSKAYNMGSSNERKSCTTMCKYISCYTCHVSNALSWLTHPCHTSQFYHVSHVILKPPKEHPTYSLSTTHSRHALPQSKCIYPPHIHHKMSMDRDPYVKQQCPICTRQLRAGTPYANHTSYPCINIWYYIYNASHTRDQVIVLMYHHAVLDNHNNVPKSCLRMISYRVITH